MNNTDLRRQLQCSGRVVSESFAERFNYGANPATDDCWAFQDESEGGETTTSSTDTTAAPQSNDPGRLPSSRARDNAALTAETQVIMDIESAIGRSLSAGERQMISGRIGEAARTMSFSPVTNDVNADRAAWIDSYLSLIHISEPTRPY